MKYQLVENDVFEWNNESYIIIDIYTHNNINYYFTNKLLNEEEPGKEFIVFKGLEDGLIVENDINILNIILPIFSSNMNKKIEMYKLYSKDGDINE